MAKIERFSLESAGVAYNLDIGFVPDFVEVWNYTKWATDATIVKSYYHRGMTDAYSLSEITDDSGVNRAITTTNGFTVIETPSVTTNQSVISGVTQANPGVTTVASTSGWTTGDKVRIRDVVGMIELNDNLYEVVVINATTFSLKDQAGDVVDTTGFTAYTSGGIAYNISKTVEAEGFYGITLGTSVIGADSDILYITASQGDNFKAIGDIE